MTIFSEQESEKLPKHVAIIMDGNGRWARSRRKATYIRAQKRG